MKAGENITQDTRYNKYSEHWAGKMFRPGDLGKQVMLMPETELGLLQHPRWSALW